jgi:hypothetical protein
MQVDHDVGDPLGVDLGEVPGGGQDPVGLLVQPGWRRRAVAQEHDQVPGAVELGVLEEAAVHHHQVVAGSAAVGCSFHSRARLVEEAEGVEGHPAATAATVGQVPGEVVGDGTGCGAGEAVDRDMDRRRTADRDDGVGERLDHLATSSSLLGLDHQVHLAVAAGEPSIAGEHCWTC